MWTIKTNKRSIHEVAIAVVRISPTAHLWPHRMSTGTTSKVNWVTSTTSRLIRTGHQDRLEPDPNDSTGQYVRTEMINQMQGARENLCIKVRLTRYDGPPTSDGHLKFIQCRQSTQSSGIMTYTHTDGVGVCHNNQL